MENNFPESDASQFREENPYTHLLKQDTFLQSRPIYYSH